MFAEKSEFIIYLNVLAVKDQGDYVIMTYCKVITVWKTWKCQGI